MSVYVIGLDFRTDSVREMIVNAHTSEAVSTGVENYPRWAQGLYYDPSNSLYRKHPMDFIESVEKSLLNALAACQVLLNNILGISMATTGSTPVPVNASTSVLKILGAVVPKVIPLTIPFKFKCASGVRLPLIQSNAAFGAKAIVMRFKEEGVPENKGDHFRWISKKSKFVLQTLANVLAVPIEVVKSEQACALGAAMFSATISKVYPDIPSAQKSTSSQFDAVFTPKPEKVFTCKMLYAKYIDLGKSCLKTNAIR